MLRSPPAGPRPAGGGALPPEEVPGATCQSICTAPSESAGHSPRPESELGAASTGESHCVLWPGSERALMDPNFEASPQPGGRDSKPHADWAGGSRTLPQLGATRVGTEA